MMAAVTPVLGNLHIWIADVVGTRSLVSCAETKSITILAFVPPEMTTNMIHHDSSPYAYCNYPNSWGLSDPTCDWKDDLS